MRLKLWRRLTQFTVPQLWVAKRVLARMVSAAHSHLADETGEAMIGLILMGDDSDGATGVPTLVILDTIAPDESALRLFHTFQQGDERQDDLIWWLQENWRLMRPQLVGAMKKYDVPLRYLGDWHKQPGFMVQPSGGDLNTALNWIEDTSNGMDFLLAPIVTLGYAHLINEAGMSYLMTPQQDDTALRVDFWYIDVDSPGFVPIMPLEIANDQVPPLPPYPWHLLDDARFAAEMRSLNDDDLFVSVTFWDADGVPPLEVCLLTARVGAEHLLIVVTPFDYPASPPSVRVTPFIHMTGEDELYDVFERAWAQSRVLPMPSDWQTEAGLLSLIHKIEAGLAGTPSDAQDESREGTA